MNQILAVFSFPLLSTIATSEWAVAETHGVLLTKDFDNQADELRAGAGQAMQMKFAAKSTLVTFNK